MSPTMTEGGIAGWKKQEGEAFTTGDVILEIVRPPPLPLLRQEMAGLILRKRIKLQSTSKLKMMESSVKSLYALLVHLQRMGGGG
jgi:hypothetical protein